MSVLMQQIAVALSLLVLWIVGDVAGALNPAVLPSIKEVAKEFVESWWRPEFLPALFGTLRTAILGIAIAAAVAIPLGILIGMFEALERSTRTLLDLGRSFPVIALLPILMLVIGANMTMKTTVVSIACCFPILLQTIYGARRLEPTILDTIRSFRIPFYLRFFRVILPSASPYIATGIRIATAVAILVSIGVEVLVPVTGLGRLITNAQNEGRPEIAFAYILYSGLLGLVVTSTWIFLEEKLLAWNRRAEDAG